MTFFLASNVHDGLSCTHLHHGANLKKGKKMLAHIKILFYHFVVNCYAASFSMWSVAFNTFQVFNTFSNLWYCKFSEKNNANITYSSIRQLKHFLCDYWTWQNHFLQDAVVLERSGDLPTSCGAIETIMHIAYIFWNKFVRGTLHYVMFWISKP